MNTNKKFDPTKPCQTRASDPVKILTTDATGNFPIYYQNEKTKTVFASLKTGRAFANMRSQDGALSEAIGKTETK